MPVPTTVGISEGGGDAGSSSGRQMKDTEVDYFRRTIFEPAMADRQKDGNAKRRTNRNDGVMS